MGQLCRRIHGLRREVTNFAYRNDAATKHPYVNASRLDRPQLYSTDFNRPKLRSPDIDKHPTRIFEHVARHRIILINQPEHRPVGAASDPQDDPAYLINGKSSKSSPHNVSYQCS